MGRSRQGQSAYLFSTKTQYKKAQWQRLFKAQEVTASGTERITRGQSRISFSFFKNPAVYASVMRDARRHCPYFQFSCPRKTYRD